jgi:hypothetical protein
MVYRTTPLSTVQYRFCDRISAGQSRRFATSPLTSGPLCIAANSLATRSPRRRESVMPEVPWTPSAWAVLRFITSSNLVGCSTGSDLWYHMGTFGIRRVLTGLRTTSSIRLLHLLTRSDHAASNSKKAVGGCRSLQLSVSFVSQWILLAQPFTTLPPWQGRKDGQ